MNTLVDLLKIRL